MSHIYGGSSGAQGPQGNPGATGPAGPQGLQGPPGLDGADGLDGEPGPPGLTGAQGATGSPGSPGATGAQGPLGPPGLDADDPEMPYVIPGPTGPQGPAGGGGGSWTTVEVNLGGVGSESWRGKFTITDATITPTSKIVIQQAPGPYTGKGTRADEAEMDPLWCVAEPGSGQATVYWRTLTGVLNLVVNDPVNSSSTVESAFQDIIPETVQQRVAGLVRGNVKFTYQVGT